MRIKQSTPQDQIQKEKVIAHLPPSVTQTGTAG